MSPDASPQDDPAVGKKRILLAEDDLAVRTLVRRSLERFEFFVIEAPDGQAALDSFEAAEGNIDLLLTDVIMPQMGGQQLAKELLARQPALPVLYTSGFADDTVLRRGNSGPPMAFLPKPFTPMEVVEAVRKLLASSEQAQSSTEP